MITTRINIIKDEASPFLRGLNAALPRASKADTKKIAGLFRNELRKNIKQQGLIWTRKLFNQTRVMPLRDGYGVSIPNYGIYLDRMKPHYVSPWKHPEIMEWEMDKNFYKPTIVYVKPHPFILSAESRANNMIDSELKRGNVYKLLTEGVYRG